MVAMIFHELQHTHHDGMYREINVTGPFSKHLVANWIGCIASMKAGLG